MLLSVSVVLHPPSFRKSRARWTVVICSTLAQVSAHSRTKQSVCRTHALLRGCRPRRSPEGLRRAPYGSCGPHAQGGCRCAAVVAVCGAGLGPASLLLLAELTETPVLLGVPEAVPVKGLRQVVLGVHVSAFRDAGLPVSRQEGLAGPCPPPGMGPDGRHRGVAPASQEASVRRTAFSAKSLKNPCASSL